MTTIAILLAEGFEEAEALIVADILRRLQFEVETIACGQDGMEVLSYHEFPVRADTRLTMRTDVLYDGVMLPGGPLGARNLGKDARVIEFVKKHLASDRLVCPFCSAGAHVMAANKLLDKRRYTCSGDNHALYDDGVYVDKKLVQDGNLLSGKGLGVAFEFAFAIASYFGLAEKAVWQAEHIYFDHWHASLLD